MSKVIAKPTKSRHPAMKIGENVGFYLGVATKPHTKGFTPADMIKSVQKGLPFGELETLQTSFGIPLEKFALNLGISKATLHRRKNDGHLTPEESDRVLRFARLMGKAIHVFETEENARQWLTTAQYGLGGAVPVDYATTEIGAREVEDLLGRIGFGVYS